MNKIQNRQAIDYEKELVTITISSEPCFKDSVESRFCLVEILRHIVQDPSLILTDTLTPDSINIEFDGEKWVLKAKVLKNR